jgi:hypothetical protein
MHLRSLRYPGRRSRNVIAGIRDGVTVHAETMEDHVETCARIGEVAEAAELSGKSLKHWAEEARQKAAG